MGPVIGVSVDATSVYWSVWSATVDDGMIRKCLLPDCSRGRITTMVVGLDQPNSIVLDNASGSRR
jgi:hypothetical protein